MIQIFEAIMIFLLCAVGVLLALVTYGMSESQKTLMEMEAEIERRQLEEKLKK